MERNTTYFGKVIINDDPERMGRCKVKVLGVFDELQDNDLPWAFPAYNSTFAGGASKGYGSISVPKIDTIVRVRFENGDAYSPVYWSIPVVNDAMKAELNDSYLNSHVITYDEDEKMKILYSPSIGLKYHLNGSHITINPDKSITIEHDATQSVIELNGSNITVVANNKIEATAPTKIEINSSNVHVNGVKTELGAAPVFSNICAEPLWVFLKALAAATDAKWPPSPGLLSSLAATAEVASTSKTVKTSL
jgi:hypothetical protein